MKDKNQAGKEETFNPGLSENLGKAKYPSRPELPTQDSMFLISSAINNVKTFRMIPIHKDCPFVEAVFNPPYKALIMVSKDHIEKPTMVPVVGSNGDMVKCDNRVDKNMKYKEERLRIDTFIEHYLYDKEEIIQMIKMFAINYNQFDFDIYLNPPIEDPEKTTGNETAILGKDGKILQMNTEENK